MGAANRSFKSMTRLRPDSALFCSLFGLLTIMAGFTPVAARAATQRERLPNLIAEASDQFELAYRAYPAEGKHRQEQLNAVVAAWRSAPRTEVNNERLNAWLRAAIQSSMPGSREPLPMTPSFATNTVRDKRPIAEPAVAGARTPEPKPANETARSSKDDSRVDPFRDDPSNKQETK
jgi:hypothetical protein